MHWREYLALSNICPLCGHSILLRSAVRYFDDAMEHHLSRQHPCYFPGYVKPPVLLWRSPLTPAAYIIARGEQQIQANRQICQVP